MGLKETLTQYILSKCCYKIFKILEVELSFIDENHNWQRSQTGSQSMYENPFTYMFYDPNCFGDPLTVDTRKQIAKAIDNKYPDIHKIIARAFKQFLIQQNFERTVRRGLLNGLYLCRSDERHRIYYSVIVSIIIIAFLTLVGYVLMYPTETKEFLQHHRLWWYWVG
uniref:Uncharacterized protein n=1 Tax=Ishige okamurae TaxID=233772 RepID=A0A4Y5T7M7_9PHAE|nr:hypothetical protein [Ishige okamurae]